ncbi:uncharacterized protein LOC109726943 isoform X3 [Ananas comosus]|nr:uncharacterized protein LOC109726943 isoform X3 [Ananas comosus]XP_020112359.1 uncharacterized protein LOC109726943 isoform X3 [Ananas comosus]
MESKMECDPSGSTSGRKEGDSCSSNGASEAVDKSKACDDNRYACAETSNLLSSTSSRDFSPENTGMKAASKEPVPCDPERSTKNEGSSMAGEVEAIIVGGQNCTASPMNEVNEADNKNPSLVSLETSDACLGTENAKDNNVPSDEVNKRSFSNEQCEKNPNLAEDSKMEVLDVRQKTTSESENSEEIEDDVKVCDICGDAGQEELLAFCSRCTDGAEHIYCMRVMLDEVPEGDWLCEECQLKEEAEKQNLDSEAPSFGAKDEEIESTVDPKILLNETKETNPDSKGSSEVLQSADISTKRNEENIEVPSLSRQSSPRKGTGSFNDSSLSNLDAEKAKQESAQHLGRALTSSASNLPRIQPPLARGSLSKSISFNNSKVAKVKQLIDDVPPKQKNAKEAASNSTRKEGLNKTITKSSSFKTTNSESLNKTKPLNPLWAEVRSVKEVKERILTSMKSTSLQQPSAIPSPRAGSSAPPPKADSEIVQHDTKGNNIPKSSNIGNSRGSDNANTIGSNEMHKSNLLKASGVALSNGLSKPSDQKTGQLVSKDKFFTSGPIDKPLGSNRASRCQKCNEAGHTTQFCAVDKLRMSALKPLADRTLSLKERSGKGIKTKDLVEVASLKPRTQVTMRSPERNAKVSTLNLDQNFESTRNLVELKEKLEVLSNQASVLTNQLRASVIPELDYIWHGDFELLRIARPPELCDGIQAHASSCASLKVLEAVTHFKSKIQLEEVPRRSSWPPQFQENGPREDNIALFFFAKDIESYERNYSKLVDSMVNNDFSLKGRIDTVELLIYPSTLLPENSQRWNKLSFLWGVFRSRRENCLQERPDLRLKPCESNLNKDLMDIDLVSASISSSGVPTSQDLNNCEKIHAAVDIANIPFSEIVHRICHQKSTSPQAAVDNKEVRRTNDKSEEEQVSFSFPESGLSKNTSEHPNILVSNPATNTQINPDRLSGVKYDSWQNNISYNSDGENDIGNALHVHGDAQMDSKDRKLANYKVPSISHLGEDTGCANITEDKIGQESLKRSQVFSDDHLEDPMDIDLPSGGLRALRKRNSSSLEIFSHSPCADLKNNGKLMHWEEDANFVSPEGQREHKKVKLDLNPNPGGDILDGKFSSKVHPLSSSLVDNNNIDSERIPESSTSAGRYFFPVDLDLGPSRTAKQEPIDILSSSDDEEAREERDAPDLELALWDAKKSPKKDTSSFSFKLAEKRKQDRPPSLAAEDGNDTTASLSLSLGFPVSEKAQAANNKATAKSENLLPDKAVVGSSFFLFNGLRDT